MPALPFCTRVVSGTSNTLSQHCATLRKPDGTWIRAIPPGRRRFTRLRFLATRQPFEFSWKMMQIPALGIPRDLRQLTWPVNGTRLRLSKRWLTQHKVRPGRAAFIDPARLTGLERFMVEIRHPLPRHGTDHDSKPLPSFPRFCLPAGHFSAEKKSIEVAVRPRKVSAAVCSRCHLPAPGYDQLAERRFEFIPLWGFLVFLLYTMRRVDCRRCGIVAVEEVPWGDGKRTTDQSLHALSPLGAATVMERNGGGLSHLLGQGLRRGGTRRHLRAGAPVAWPNRCDRRR